jgi:hypothetical protein
MPASSEIDVSVTGGNVVLRVVVADHRLGMSSLDFIVATCAGERLTESHCDAAKNTFTQSRE